MITISKRVPALFRGKRYQTNYSSAPNPVIKKYFNSSKTTTTNYSLVQR